MPTTAPFAVVTAIATLPANPHRPGLYLWRCTPPPVRAGRRACSCRGVAAPAAARPWRERRGEFSGDLRPDFEPAPDVPEHPAEVGLEAFDLAPGPLHLAGVGVTTGQPQRLLAEPGVTLAQRHAMAFGQQAHQDLAAALVEARVSRGWAIALGCTVVSMLTRSRLWGSTASLRRAAAIVSSASPRSRS